MAAPEGNNYNMKWKTAEERKAACDRLCAHLRSGLSMSCFEADDETVARYVRDFPEDFARVKIEEAVRDGQKIWEMIGMNASMGRIKGFSPAAWIFVMKNRFKWRDVNTFAGDPENPINPNHTTIEIVHTTKASSEKAASDAPADS